MIDLRMVRIVDSEPTNPNKVMKSVDRALGMLRYFTVPEPELGLAELTRRANLDKATVYRILTALSRNGLLEQIPATKKYRLGSEALRLAQVREASVPISSIITPILNHLATECGETAHATLASGDGMLSIGIIEPQRATRVYLDPSTILPFYATASGQAYSAFSDPEQLKAVLQANKYVAFTAATPKNEHDFIRQVEIARQNGFAVAHGTLEEDTVGVAAPFFDAGGRVVGAVAVAGLKSRMSGEALARTGALVCAATKEVTHQLGGTHRA